MEQDTFIPGMNGGNANDPYSNNPAPRGYQQESTMIEGLNYGGPAAPTQAAPQGSPRTNTPQGGGQTPVVGFLYSVSKNGFPEFWPLYVGQNRIGKGADMDICLREGSVSEHHADIQIKKMRSAGGRLIATIVDAGSKNGIVLNDEELDYDRHALKDRDIITVGLSYKLAFILIDPVEYGLEVCETFVPLEQPKAQPQRPAEPMIPDNSTHPGHAAVPPTPYGNPYADVTPIQDETINIQGGNISGLNAGGTRIL